MFPETVVPRDFDVIEVPFAERGAPAARQGRGARTGASPRPYHRRRNDGHGQVAVAGDVAEAEEIQEILGAPGIEPRSGDGEDDSVTVSVRRKGSVERAQDAIEAMTEPEDVIGEP